MEHLKIHFPISKEKLTNISPYNFSRNPHVLGVVSNYARTKFQLSGWPGSILNI